MTGVTPEGGRLGLSLTTLPLPLSLFAPWHGFYPKTCERVLGVAPDVVHLKPKSPRSRGDSVFRPNLQGALQGERDSNLLENANSTTCKSAHDTKGKKSS